MQKFEDVSGDAARRLIRRLESAVAVGRVSHHDRNNFFRGNLEIRSANALAGADQRDRPAIRRRLKAVINVVHAFERRRLPRVHFENHTLGLVDPRLVVANRRTRNQPPVFKHRRDFDQRDIQLAEKAVLDKLRHVAQVDVHVVHLARVDALARLRVRLVGKPQVNATRHRQRAIELRPGRGAGEYTHLEFLPAQVGLGDAPREFDWHGLGVARAGKTAHAHLVATTDQGRGLCGTHNF